MRRPRNNSVGHAIGEFFQHPFKSIAHSIGEGVTELGNALGGVVHAVVTPVSQGISQTVVGVAPAVKTSLEGIGGASSNIISSLAAPLSELKYPLIVGAVILVIILTRK